MDSPWTKDFQVRVRKIAVDALISVGMYLRCCATDTNISSSLSVCERRRWLQYAFLRTDRKLSLLASVDRTSHTTLEIVSEQINSTAICFDVAL